MTTTQQLIIFMNKKTQYMGDQVVGQLLTVEQNMDMTMKINWGFIQMTQYIPNLNRYEFQFT